MIYIKECGRHINPLNGDISIEYQIIPKPGAQLWINMGEAYHRQILSLSFSVLIRARDQSQFPPHPPHPPHQVP